MRLKTSLQFAGGRIIPAGLTLATTPIITRLLEADTYGQLSLLLSYATAISAAMFGWCEASAVRELSLNRHGAKESFRRRAGGLWAALALTGLGASAVSAFVLGSSTAILLVLTSVLFGCVNLIVGSVRGAGNAGAFLTATLLANGGRSIAGVVIALVGFSFAKYFSGWILFLLVALLFTIRPAGFKFDQFRPRIPELSFIAYVAPISGVTLSIILLQLVDRLVLSIFVEPAQLGVYALGYSLTETGVVVVFSVLHSRGFPELLQRWGTDRETGKAIVRNQIYATSFFPLALIPVFATLGSDLLNLVGGEGFGDNSSTFMVLVALGLAFYGAGQWAAVSLQYSRFSNRWLISTASGVLVNVSVVFLIGERYGITAGGVATVLSYGTMLLLCVWLSREPGMWQFVSAGLRIPLFAAALGFCAASAPFPVSATSSAILGTLVYLGIIGYDRRAFLLNVSGTLTEGIKLRLSQNRKHGHKT